MNEEQTEEQKPSSRERDKRNEEFAPSAVERKARSRNSRKSRRSPARSGLGELCVRVIQTSQGMLGQIDLKEYGRLEPQLAPDYKNWLEVSGSADDAQ